MSTFSRDMERWEKKTVRKLEAVAKTAFQDVAESANTPRAKGGNMPVDTGFLINSGQAALNSVPSGPSSTGNMSAVPVVINGLRLGDSIFFGWTANYAPIMEARYAYMGMAVQKWPQFVDAAAKEADRRIK